MDLDNLSTADGAAAGRKMELTHPATGAVLRQDDGKTPITITLAGQDSETFKKADRAIADRRLGSMSSGRRVTPTSEGLEGDNLTRIVVCTLAWDGVKVSGEAVACTPDTARDLYVRFPWIREQAEGFITDRRNFMPTAAAA